MATQTPLYYVHKALGANLTDFHGFLLPIDYSNITEEHLAVRNKAGIFDLSHMGEIEVSGKRALGFIQRIITNDAEKLQDGKALYTPVCNERGGVVDDIILYRFSDERFLLIVNSANRQKMFEWLIGNQAEGVKVNDLSDEFGMIAVQGPLCATIVARTLGSEEANLKRFHFVARKEGTTTTIISRTGYTGEDGFEIYTPVSECEAMWNRIMAAGRRAGLLPAGLGARDTLRLEAGLLLYGNDIDDDTTPLEAGIGWTVKFHKEDFIGKAALLAQEASGIQKRLVGLELVERGVPRAGHPIYADSSTVGKVTSGTHSPFFKKGIAIGYVEEERSKAGTPLCVGIRGRKLGARVVRLPFYRFRTDRKVSTL